VREGKKRSLIVRMGEHMISDALKSKVTEPRLVGVASGLKHQLFRAL